MMPRRRFLQATVVGTAICLPVGEGLAIGTLALWLIWILMHPQQVDWRRLAAPALRLPGVGLCLFFLAGGLAYGLGPYGLLRSSGLGRFYFYLILPLAWISRPLLPDAVWRRAAQAFVGSLCVAALFGIWQAAADAHLLERLSRSAYGQASQAWVPGSQHAVAGGFYYHRLKMAHVLLVGLCGLLPCLLWPSRQWGWRRRAGHGMLLAGLAVALGLTYAHAAWAAALVSGVFLGWLRWGRRAWARGAVALGFVSVLLWVLLLGLKSKTRREGADPLPSASAMTHGRALIWEQAVRIIEEDPWGIGLGNYPSVATTYYAALRPNMAPRAYPHQVALAAWAEAGPIGVLGTLCFWFGLGRLYLQAAASPAGSGAMRRRAATGAACVACFCCLGSGHDVFYHNAVAMSFCAALAWALPDA
jgi:hypothetical protein